MIVGQVSGIKARLHQESATVFDTDKTLYLHVIWLPNGALCIETEEANTQLLQIKNFCLNLVTLPIQTMHELHQGVCDELRVMEKRVLLVISEVKANNQ